MLLLGILYCPDRNNYKAQVFFSILKSVTKSPVTDSVCSENDLYSMDEAIESTVFKMCTLASMLIEHHALPARPGKTEIKTL